MTNAKRLDSVIEVIRNRNLRFPERPAIPRDVRVARLPKNLGYVFRGGPEPVVFRGAAASITIPFLLSMLDGSRSLDALIAARPRRLRADALLQALLALHLKGLLVDLPSNTKSGVGQTIRNQLLYWERYLGISRNATSADEVQRRIEVGRITLIGNGLFGLATYESLAQTGFSNMTVVGWNDNTFLTAIRKHQHPPRRILSLKKPSSESLSKILDRIAEPELVLTATRNTPWWAFERINEVSLKNMWPYLLGAERNGVFELGPYVIPRRSACFRCLQTRRMAASPFPVEDWFDDQALASESVAQSRPLRGESVPGSGLAASALTLEVVRIIGAIAAPIYLNGVATFSPLTGVMKSNKVMRVPRCDACYGGESPGVARH